MFVFEIFINISLSIQVTNMSYVSLERYLYKSFCLFVALKSMENGQKDCR